MNIFVKDNNPLRQEFFEFIQPENRPETVEECETQLLEMLNRHGAIIKRAVLAHHLTKLIAANNIPRAIKLFNVGIPERTTRTWVLFPLLLIILAILAAMNHFI